MSVRKTYNTQKTFINTNIDSLETSSVQTLVHYKNIKQNTGTLSLLACLLSIIIIGYVNFTYKKYTTSIFTSLLSYRESSKMFLEKNLRVIRGSILLFTLFLISTSLFIQQTYQYYNSNQVNSSEYINYLSIALILLTVYTTKAIIIRLCGYIFNIENEAKEYIHTIFTLNRTYGIIIIPIICFIPYIKPFAQEILIITGLIAALILFILRLFRGIWILFKKQLSIFYMILYLCALEILPLLILLKTIATEFRV